MGDMMAPLYSGDRRPVLSRVRDYKDESIFTSLKKGFVTFAGNGTIVVDFFSPYLNCLTRPDVKNEFKYISNDSIQQIEANAWDILDSKGIFLINYPMPTILITQSLDEFNSHRLSRAPELVRAFENDAGVVILRNDFFDNDWLTNELKSESIAHEVLHGIHDFAVMKSFIGVTPPEMQKFKREFINEKRHIGLVEGLMGQLSRGQPNWELVFYMMKREGIYDLKSLKKQMFLGEGDTSYNQSYISAHVIVNGMSEYISSNKSKFIEILNQNSVTLIPDFDMKQYRRSINYQNLTGEAILFRIVVEYMIQMFDLFRNGGQAVDFEIFFEQITNTKFGEVEDFAWKKLQEEGKRRGFEMIKKITVV